MNEHTSPAPIFEPGAITDEMNGLLTLASNTLDAVCVLEQRIATILTPTPPAPTAATEKNNPARSAMVINLAEISNILRLAAEELNNITQRVEL